MISGYCNEGTSGGEKARQRWDKHGGRKTAHFNDLAAFTSDELVVDE